MLIVAKFGAGFHDDRDFIQAIRPGHLDFVVWGEPFAAQDQLLDLRGEDIHAAHYQHIVGAAADLCHPPHRRHGTWKQTGPNRYTWTFYFYEPTTSFPGYPLLLKTRVVENILITGNGDTYETKAQIQPLNPLTGAVLETVDGTVTATRLALSSYSAQP